MKCGKIVKIIIIFLKENEWKWLTMNENGGIYNIQDIKRLKTFKNTKDNEKNNKIMKKGSY